jgi:hypoxanthine phosphoribosyltransferase
MKQKVTLKDKTFELFIPFEKIMEAIDKLAEKMNKELAESDPIFLVVLNGSFMFSADLLKKINFDCQVSFVKLASYEGTHSSYNVKKLIGLNEEIKGRSIVVLEDIIDTGLTMEKLFEELNQCEPKEILIATLLFKPNAIIKDIDIDYVGIEIPNDFIVGYGLDYDGYGRNLKDIYKIVSE